MFNVDTSSNTRKHGDTKLRTIDEWYKYNTMCVSMIIPQSQRKKASICTIIDGGNEQNM